MQSLDGNAIAGALIEFFGHQMTTARGAGAHCGAPRSPSSPSTCRAPGAVVRCRSCDAEVIVLVRIRGVTRVALDDFGLLDRPDPQAPPDASP